MEYIISLITILTLLLTITPKLPIVENLDPHIMAAASSVSASIETSDQIDEQVLADSKANRNLNVYQQQGSVPTSQSDFQRQKFYSIPPGYFGSFAEAESYGYSQLNGKDKASCQVYLAGYLPNGTPYYGVDFWSSNN